MSASGRPSCQVSDDWAGPLVRVVQCAALHASGSPSCFVVAVLRDVLNFWRRGVAHISIYEGGVDLHRDGLWSSCVAHRSSLVDMERTECNRRLRDAEVHPLFRRKLRRERIMVVCGEDVVELVLDSPLRLRGFHRGHGAVLVLCSEACQQLQKLDYLKVHMGVLEKANVVCSVS